MTWSDHEENDLASRLFGYMMLFLNIALILGLIVSAVWMLAEPHTLSIEMHTVISSNLSADVNQLRILYVSDIHQSSFPFYSGGSDLVMRINAQRPDLVLLGGDYAMDSQGAARFFADMPRIRATYGVYAVFGECDRVCTDDEFSQLRAAMLKAGVTPIVNDVAVVRIGASNICIAGLDDLIAGTPQLEAVAARCKADDFTILLCHNPEIIPDAFNTNGGDGKRSWFDLGLFGHTHGSQVPLLSSILGLQRSRTAYQAGWYNPNRIELLVSRGVGTCKLPIRMGCAPQMHMITVRSK